MLNNAKLHTFLGVIEGQLPSISSQINEGISKTVAKNRLILRSIVKIIIFCGRQNIGLCGNHENLLNVQVDKNDVLCHGNLLALQKFRVYSSDSILAKQLRKEQKMHHTHRKAFRINRSQL